MKAWSLLFASLIALAPVNGSSGQDADWQELYDAGCSANDNEDFAGALKSLNQALQSARTEPDPKLKAQHLSASLSALADAYFGLEKYNRAVKAYSQAIQFHKAAGDADCSELADAYLGLGKAQDANGDSAGAESSMREALRIYSSSKGKESIEVAHTQNALAGLLRDEGNYGEAETLYKSSLAIKEKVLGENDGDTAVSALNLGSFYKSIAKYELAEPLIRRAIAIDTKVYGEESDDVAGDMSELADCLLEAGKYKEAEPAFEQALAIFAKVAKPDDDDYAQCLEGQAKLYRCTKRVDAAEKLEQRVDAIYAQSKDSVTSFLSKPFTDKWAVCIGISEFQDPANDLSWPAKDAGDVGGFLINKAGFPASHVKVLTNEQATRQNILNAVGDEWLPANAQEDDLVVIMMSSHGSSASAEDGGFNFLITYDTDDDDWAGTAIPMQELMRMVKNNIRANRVIIILDACHSGASAVGDKRVPRRGNFDARLLAHDAGQVIICSSKPDELSTDADEFQNGAFTHYFLEGLQLRERETTLGEAFRYTQKKVVEYSDNDDDPQTPVMKGLWNADSIKIAAPIVTSDAVASSDDASDDDSEEDAWADEVNRVSKKDNNQ